MYEWLMAGVYMIGCWLGYGRCLGAETLVDLDAPLDMRRSGSISPSPHSRIVMAVQGPQSYPPVAKSCSEDEIRPSW